MSKKVKIFTTPTCTYCRQAKEFLDEKGVAYEAFDVTSNGDALKEMREISGGARTVPVIAVGDEVLVGFDRAELDKALKSAGL